MKAYLINILILLMTITSVVMPACSERFEAFKYSNKAYIWIRASNQPKDIKFIFNFAVPLASFRINENTKQNLINLLSSVWPEEPEDAIASTDTILEESRLRLEIRRGSLLTAICRPPAAATGFGNRFFQHYKDPDFPSPIPTIGTAAISLDVPSDVNYQYFLTPTACTKPGTRRRVVPKIQLGDEVYIVQGRKSVIAKTKFLPCDDYLDRCDSLYGNPL